MPSIAANIRLGGCFVFNDPLRQYFNLYRTVSQREEKEEKKNRQEKKIPSNPHPHLLKAQSALALVLSRLVGRPGTESYQRHHPTRPHPSANNNISLCKNQSRTILSFHMQIHKSQCMVTTNSKAQTRLWMHRLV